MHLSEPPRSGDRVAEVGQHPVDIPVVAVLTGRKVPQQISLEPELELVGGALVQHLQGKDGRGVLDGPGVDLVERGGAVPDRQVPAEVATHGDRREHRSAVPVLPPPPPDLALAMVEPVLVRLQLFRPAAGGERSQRRVEDHHRPVHQVSEALRQRSHARRVERGPRQLALQEDRPLQLAALSAHLAEQVG